MKNKSQPTRRGAVRRVSKPAAPARRAFLEVHPNVVIAHEGDASAPLFRHPVNSGTLPGIKTAFVFAAGLRSSGYAVEVSEFDANGQPIAPAPASES